MSGVDPQLNADDLEAVAAAARELDDIDSVGLHGTLMVDNGGKHLGYFVVKSDVETMFTQRSPS